MGERTRREVAVSGVVKSAAMDKTIVVEVMRRFEHPRYGKYVVRSAKYYAHDPKGEARKGDQVEIVQTRPISKLKRWRLVKVIAKGTEEVPPAVDATVAGGEG